MISRIKRWLGRKPQLDPIPKNSGGAEATPEELAKVISFARDNPEKLTKRRRRGLD